MNDHRSFSRVFEDVQTTYGPPEARRIEGESDNQWFDRQYDSWRYRLVAELLSENCPPDGHVVDIGAWPGLFTVCLRRLGWNVTAVDKSITRSVAWKPSALESREWLQMTRSSELSLETMCRAEGFGVANADIEYEPLPFDSASIDAVVLTEVIEHVWKRPLFVLSEINRVLRPASGVLILSTPNLLSIRNRIEFLRGRIDQVIEHPFVSFLKSERIGHLGHLRLYAPGELIETLELLGYSCVVRYESIQSVPTIPSTPAGSSARGFGGTVSRHLKRLFKSRADYAAAIRATIIEFGERRVPHLRGRMFIVAKKLRDANFETNCPDQVRRLISHNTLTSAA
jgi:SAM-dependent methyltransferase